VVAAILVTLGILGGSLFGQFAVMLGRAGGVSDAMSRIVGAVVFGVGAALTIPSRTRCRRGESSRCSWF